MRKSIKKLWLIAIPLALAAVAAVGCEKPDKPDVGDDKVWESNEIGHWLPAENGGQRGETLAHSYTDRVVPCAENAGGESGYILYTCTVCKYSFKRDIGHSYSDVLEGDEYEHWRPATCSHGGKADVAEHALVGRSNECVVCGKAVQPRLSYTLSENGNYYIVTGLGCIDSKAITIPAEYRGKPVCEIAPRVFKDTDITSVTFGTNVKVIGTEAFANTAVSALSLPSGLEEIGTKAFANTAITTLSLGANIEKIGNAVFRDCALLQTVTIAGNLAEIPSYTFENCVKLTSVSGSIAGIGAQAFANCKELTSLDLSEATSVGFAAFADCIKYAPTNLAKLAAAEEYAFSGTAISAIALPKLNEVADNLFNGCEKLTTVTLSAESIGKSAFEGCVALDTLSLTSTKLIGENAFKGCESLTELTLPEEVIRVGVNAFEGTELISTEGGVNYAANVAIGLASGNTVALKDGTVGIADGAFQKANITAVTLNSGVRFIGVDAFRESKNFTEITFTDSVKYIGANSFRKSGLTTVTVPATVLSVGDNAFYDCESLTSVTVNAKEIGKFAFSYTGVNRSLNSPVKERPDYAKLATVTLGEGVEVIGSNAFQYALITSVTLPESLKEIGRYAFAQTELTEITVPASVTRIGQYAFYLSKISSATFAEAQGWKAGKNALNLNTASQNATYLKNTYLDYDWIKEVAE